MNHNITRHGDQSPFDAIKQTRPDGSEFWSARDLAPMMEYPRWHDFKPVIERAMIAAQNQGYSIDELFRVNPEKTSGRPREDFELAKFAAYLVAMNGDPRKTAVAAAQGYFAIRTHEAETRPALSGRELMARALLEADSTIRELESRATTAEAHARELEAPAKSWNTMASAGGDYSVAEAAKSLSRDPQITIGRDQLFAFLHEQGWTFRTRGHRAHWEANQQKSINTGRLVHKLSRPFLNESTGEWEQGKPTVRVTPKGLHELHLLLGGSGQLELVDVS